VHEIKFLYPKKRRGGRLIKEPEIVDENEFRNVRDYCWNLHRNEIRIIAKI
jgi:hypothetical protein